MSTGSVNVIDESFKAARDLSGGKYKGVKVSADDTVDYPSAGTDPMIGVLQNKPAAAGRGAQVVFVGRTKAYLTGTVTAGTGVSATTSGWFVRTTSGYRQHGVCIKAANSGYPGEVFLVGVADHMSVSSVDAGQI